MAKLDPRLWRPSRMFGGLLCLGFLAIVAAACSTQASYPAKGISLICPSGAGGASDLAAKPLADYVGKKWSQPVTMDYKTGAGGTTGTLAALQAAPDGYTLATVANSQGTINPALEKDLPYKWDQPTPIALFNTNIMVLTVKGDAKWNTAKEFMDDIAKNPAGFKHGTSSPAGPSTLCTAQLLFGANIDASKVDRVVFQGGAPMTAAVAGGHVDFIVGSVSEVQSLVQAKNLKALMVTGAQRLKEMPDVPTSKEAGYPYFTWVGYTGIWGPAKLPDAVVTKWTDTIKEATQDKAFQDQLRAAGGEPSYLGPQDFKAFLQKSYDETAKILDQLKLR